MVVDGQKDIQVNAVESGVLVFESFDSYGRYTNYRLNYTTYSPNIFFNCSLSISVPAKSSKLLSAASII